MSDEKEVMHKDFFDRCRYMIDNGYYFGAILIEYAAIEGRLEVIMSRLRLPCNSFIDNKDRRIDISHRIKCLNKHRKKNPAMVGTKLPENFFSKNSDLMKWIDERNGIVHGLYKNVIRYYERLEMAKDLAEDGLTYCRLLYNEAKRLGRVSKSHPERIKTDIGCFDDRCNLLIKKKGKQS